MYEAAVPPTMCSTAPRSVTWQKNTSMSRVNETVPHKNNPNLLTD